MRRLLVACLLAAACATGPSRPERPPAAAADGAPARALVDFLDAVDAGRLEDAYRGLSARWRARLTPARLGDDLAEGGAVARDRLARARAAAAGSPRIEDAEAGFPVGEGKAVRLVREPSGWKVDALE